MVLSRGLDTALCFCFSKCESETGVPWAFKTVKKHIKDDEVLISSMQKWHMDVSMANELIALVHDRIERTRKSLMLSVSNRKGQLLSSTSCYRFQVLNINFLS